MNIQMQRDVEELAGKLFNGDMTPIVFDLIKKTKYKDQCLEYLGCKQKEISKDEEQTEKLDFTSWFNSFKEVR